MENVNGFMEEMSNLALNNEFIILPKLSTYIQLARVWELEHASELLVNF